MPRKIVVILRGSHSWRLEGRRIPMQHEGDARTPKRRLPPGIDLDDFSSIQGEPGGGDGAPSSVIANGTLIVSEVFAGSIIEDNSVQGTEGGAAYAIDLWGYRRE